MNDLNGTIADSDNQSLINDTNIELDWEQYFREFCSAHGKYPIIHGDNEEYLLFPDGWMYSSNHYEGPEYPPPTDLEELNELKIIYWRRRYIIVKTEHDNIAFAIQQLKAIQEVKSLPLQQRVEYKDDEGKVNTLSSNLDLSIVQKRLDWLKGDIKQCRTHLGYHILNFNANE